MLETFFETLKWINHCFGNLIEAMATLIVGFLGFNFYKAYKDSKSKEGDAALIVKNWFFSFRGARYKVLAVHKYEKDDSASGYSSHQYSRKDQWINLIDIHQNWLIFFKVVPRSINDILTVVISRNGREKWREMKFNQ